MKKLMMLLCAFAAGVAMADGYDDLLPETAQDWPQHFLESQNRPSVLADENVYIVTNDVVFTGEAGESALRVAENATTNVTVTGGEPGFYYTLYGAAGVRALPTTGTAYGSVLCGTDRDVEFSGVAKPSAAAGFFTISVKDTPDVQHD